MQDDTANTLGSQQAHVSIIKHGLSQVESRPVIIEKHHDEQDLAEDTDEDMDVELGTLHLVRLIALHGCILPPDHLSLAL